MAPPDPDEAEVAVHRPLLVVHARAKQLAGALLGAPLAAGIVERQLLEPFAAAAGGLVALRRSIAPRISGADRTRAIRASASRANSIASWAVSPRGARKEDHALRLDRNVAEVLDELRLATPAAGVRRRDRRPHALVELAPELLDEALLVLLHARIALGEENLTMTGLHAQELDRSLLRGPSRVARSAVGGGLSIMARRGARLAVREADGVDRAGALADVAQAVANSLGGDQLGVFGRLQRVEAEREPGRERGRMCAARSVCSPVWVALARNLDQSIAVEEDVGCLRAVAARDDDGLRAERGSLCERRGVSVLVIRQDPRFRQVRCHHGHEWQESVSQRVERLLVEQPRAALGDHHGVEDDGRLRNQAERGGDGPDRLGRAEHADLDGVDADVGGDGAHLLRDGLRRQRVDGRDAGRVLRRDRRDRGHSVDPAAGEGLQVGLNAGAAAGVRAGDRQNAPGAISVGHLCGEDRGVFRGFVTRASPRVTRPGLAWLPVLAAVSTFALEGIRSHEVTVEVDVRRGLPAFTLVGLPDRAVRESRERVRAALLNSELGFPQQRITVNLAPAHVRKAGPAFDLGIAVGLLAACGRVPAEALAGCPLAGELSLSGEIRPIRGALAAAWERERPATRGSSCPSRTPPRRARGRGVGERHPSLARLADMLHGRWEPEPVSPALPVARRDDAALDLADVRGQEDAKRALEIAAAGGHNLLMVGPPGAGKTMLARRLPGSCRRPFEEALEITQVHSVAGIGSGTLAAERPFRAPHHTISPQGLVGGGARPMPGEITLAHRGVLFLDELPEFSRMAVDALRQPLEEGLVEVMRGQRTLEFPANAIVVAACNRCPCARPADRCDCEPGQLARYRRRLSGPLVDRIDLVCQVERVAAVELVGAARGRPVRSADVLARVVAARERQRERLRGTSALCNGDMDGRLTRSQVPLDGELQRGSSPSGAASI